MAPSAAQWQALELARKTGILRRVGGVWVSTVGLDGLPEKIPFPYVPTVTVRACISRGWLEHRSRDVVSITQFGKQVLTQRHKTK